MNKQFRLTTICFTAALIFCALATTVTAQVATGGTYTLNQAVIASGGGTTSGGSFTVESTSGQTLAGGLISTAPFNIFSGFWTPEIVLPSLQFSSATYSVNENGATATITVNRTGDTGAVSSVNYAASGNTATGGAMCGGAGIDYEFTTGTLNFAVGVLSQTFNVTICDDALVEGDETVNLTLSMPTGATLGTPNTAVLTIVDNDVAPTPTPTPTPTSTPTPTPTLTPTATPTPMGTVSGRVTYANASTTTGVPFTTINAVGSIPLLTTTDANGFYSISGFGSGAYTITPSKTNQVNGISNLDASTVAQHIVGLTVLNANQLVAADTTGNGSISSLDAAYIAQFVAAIPNPSITGMWKFLPSSRSYPNVLSNQSNQDFSAILVGDVTGNWNPSGSLYPELSGLESGLTTQTDTTGQQVIITAETNESAGEETALTVNLTATETTGKDILGYQFDLLYDAEVIAPQVVSCDVSDTISRDLTAICHVSEPGVLKVVVFGATPLSSQGTLVKLNFKVVGIGVSISGLTIENFMFNEDSPQQITVLTK